MANCAQRVFLFFSSRGFFRLWVSFLCGYRKWRIYPRRWAACRDGISISLWEWSCNDFARLGFVPVTYRRDSMGFCLHYISCDQCYVPLPCDPRCDDLHRLA